MLGPSTSDHRETAAAWRFGPDLAIVAIFAALARVAFALVVTHPSYMDSYYYAAVAKSLLHGTGFTIDSVWNFLEVGGTIPGPGMGLLPVPSNRYWMPLASILQWPFLALLGDSYRAAQAPFLLLGIAVPVLTAYVGADLFGSRRVALGAGILATFSGTLAAYWDVIDTFGLFGLTGGLTLVCCYKGLRGHALWFALSGACAGLGALTRIDGVFLVVPVAFAVVLSRSAGSDERIPRPARIPFWSAALATAFFLSALAPWFVREHLVFGSILPAAGRSTLLPRSFNDLYSVSANLSLDAYLRWGVTNIARSKLVSLGWITMQLAGLMSLVLFPMLLVGISIERRRRDLWPFFLYAALVHFTMAFVFTFYAPRGSFLHSAAAWVPFLFPLAVVGFDRTVEWTAKHRGWDAKQAQRNLGRVGLVGLILSGCVHGASSVSLSFDDQTVRRVRPVAEFLEKNTAPDEVILCVDPPTYTAITGRRCVITPYDGLDVLETVARAYRPSYVAFDRKELVPSGVEVMMKGNVPRWLSRRPAFQSTYVWLYKVDLSSLGQDIDQTSTRLPSP